MYYLRTSPGKRCIYVFEKNGAHYGEGTAFKKGKKRYYFIGHIIHIIKDERLVTTKYEIGQRISPNKEECRLLESHEIVALRLLGKI